jgi:lysozyme family protein
MAQSTYIAFVDRMIKRYEGGYGWNRKDPGGPTKYGVTCWDLAEHRGQKMDSMARWAPLVQAMELSEAEAIYKTKYAAAIRYDDLPAGVDALFMDYAVNSGVSRPIIVIRRMLNVPGSSRMDQALLDAIKKIDPSWIIKTMCAERLQFMHSIRGGEAWAEFGNGWSARVSDLQLYCLHLATASQPAVATSPAPEAPDLSKLAMPKATHVAQTAGKTTVATAAAAGTASHVGAGLPVHWTAAIVIGVFVLGIAYEAYQDFKTNAANNRVFLPAAA